MGAQEEMRWQTLSGRGGSVIPARVWRGPPRPIREHDFLRALNRCGSRLASVTQTIPGDGRMGRLYSGLLRAHIPKAPPVKRTLEITKGF
jgi:hypothetical protein